MQCPTPRRPDSMHGPSLCNNKFRQCTIAQTGSTLGLLPRKTCNIAAVHSAVFAYNVCESIRQRDSDWLCLIPIYSFRQPLSARKRYLSALESGTGTGIRLQHIRLIFCYKELSQPIIL
jgi:hypothetical protein